MRTTEFLAVVEKGDRALVETLLAEDRAFAGEQRELAEILRMLRAKS